MKIVKAHAGEKEKQSLIQKLSLLKGKKILIVGDVGLDEYLMGQVRRISPEAPVPVLEVDQEDNRLGLAANVAQNISSLGGVPLLLSVVGQDLGAQILKDLCLKSQVSWDNMITDHQRPTTRKTRIMTGHHHIVRVDHEVKKYLSSHKEAELFGRFADLIDQADAVILEDYAKGVISAELVQKISLLCRQKGKKLLVDPNRNNKGTFYAGVDLIKPNFDEAMDLAGLNYEDMKGRPDRVIEAGRALQKITGAHEVVLTRGKEGMVIFQGEEITEVPTYARKVFDVTGAGDTVIAALSLGLAANLNLVEACMLANFAAGVVVGKVGCVPCEIPELIEYIEEDHHGV